ncbi:MAG: pyridoxamine 5'-phosphate oxidase family protein [Sphaerochaetaceae bacterium]|jgi:flavin reductase (DIM6/NTAB) family NADH-FMN oxidoreductase RutF
MIDEKLIKLINTPPDSAAAIVTNNKEGAHVVNTWNSYIKVVDNKYLLIPVGRMNQTEKNLEEDKRVLLTISNREVMGLSYKGTGFLVEGEGSIVNNGPYYEIIKESFSWAKGVLVIEVREQQQTL